MTGLDIDHWDEFTERTVESNYRVSEKEGMIFHTACRTHVPKEVVLDNAGECPECAHLAKQQESVRGAL